MITERNFNEEYEDVKNISFADAIKKRVIEVLEDFFNDPEYSGKGIDTDIDDVVDALEEHFDEIINDYVLDDLPFQESIVELDDLAEIEQEDEDTDL